MTLLVKSHVVTPPGDKKKTTRGSRAKGRKKRKKVTVIIPSSFPLLVHLLPLDDALLLLLGTEVQRDEERARDEHAHDDSEGGRAVVREELGGELRQRAGRVGREGGERGADRCRRP